MTMLAHSHRTHYFLAAIIGISFLSFWGCAERTSKKDQQEAIEVPVRSEPIQKEELSQFEEPLGFTWDVKNTAETEALLREWVIARGGAMLSDSGNPHIILLMRSQVPGFVSEFFGDAVGWIDPLRFPDALPYLSSARQQAFANDIERLGGEYIHPNPDDIISLEITLQQDNDQSPSVVPQ